MKKAFSFIISMIFAGLLSAQTTQAPLLAEFRYNDESIEQAIKNNSVSVFISNISNDSQLAKLKETGGNYSQYFSMSVGEALKNGARKCKFNFKDNNVQTNILMRFLISNSIGQLIFDGKQTSMEDFFKKYNSPVK